ncbi:MAG TPA: alpha/beta hydrolase [Planctomycetia bacterium]|nr:alpha/beta hydrolase [Planctomycetia bacterium]
MSSAAFIFTLILSAPTLAAAPKGFTFEGDRFTFKDGDLSFAGILLKPAGKGPFPALLISHGMGGNGERFGRPKAKDFVARGYICLAPDYAHAGEPGGGKGPRKGARPGKKGPAADRRDFGASPENICRANKCLDLLESLPEADRRRIFAYGNSMGAFLTIGLAADSPGRLAAAAITAGGVNTVAGYAAPSKEQAGKISTPFLILHGTTDTTVPPERSGSLEEVLKSNHVDCERVLYEGVGHELHGARAADVADRLDRWFKAHSKSK